MIAFHDEPQVKAFINRYNEIHRGAHRLDLSPT